MNNRVHRMLLFAVLCLVAWPWGRACASLHLSVGIGATFGGWHRYHGHRPYWSWCGYPHPYPFWHAYPYWPYHSSAVVIEAPIVVAEKHAKAESPQPSRAQSVDVPDEATQRLCGELRKVLRIGGSEDRVKAAQELALHTRDAQVRAALERGLLADRDAGVRKRVAEALSQAGNEKLVPALRRAYREDADRSVRQAAYRAIIMIEGY